MFGMVAKFKTHSGQREALVTHLLEAAKALGDLDDCYLYIVNEDANDPDTVWVTEVWEGQDAHQASLTLESVQQLIAAARPLLAAPPESTALKPVGGKGLSV